MLPATMAIHTEVVTAAVLRWRRVFRYEVLWRCEVPR
jgi:hypothetical protein